MAPSAAEIDDSLETSHAANGNLPFNWVPIFEKPLYSPRKLRVVCVGAGFSGLLLAYHLRDMKMEDYIDFRIYEKNHDVGGVWLENKYPGLSCDVPAHIYTFSFEPNPDWTSFYAKGPEIWEYIKRTTIKYNLDRDAQFNSKIVASVWDETTKKWKLKIDVEGAVFEDEADVLVNAAGALNKWKWPKIEGLHSFKGELLHSARWNDNVKWNGKRVAVLGNGSSAIQIVPQIQPTADKLVNYVRTPTWISANYAYQFTKDGRNFKYTEEEKKEFRDHPEIFFKMRHEIEASINSFFHAMLSDTPGQVAATEGFTQMMHARLNHDPELIKRFVPEWKVGCRRLTPGDGYLEALQEKNATSDWDPILRIVEKGIETSKGVEEFDLIVCATGFDVSFRPHWHAVGRNGKSLEKDWAENPEAYMGICAEDMPNYFTFNGPNSPVGHGSLLSVMGWTAEYILKWCKKIATEGISSVAVKSRALEDYNTYTHEFLKRTVWSSGCRSWYKNGKIDGKVTAMYAGSILHFKEILDTLRGEDFEIEYKSKNSFRFMGNGMTLREERGEDLAYYMTK